MKPDSAILPNKNPFVIPAFSNDIHHEVEILVKICRVGKHIDAKFAHKYYEEIGLGIDFTARDVQNKLKEKGLPWEKAKALIELTGKEVPVKIIGTRHGEKLYETLCTREEMQKAEDMGDFYRIPADNRDLNYAKYFSEGEEDMSKIEDYHSHNTEQQGVEGLKKLISKLPLIRKEIFGEDVLQYPM
jgi:hypothetical protein